MPKDTQVTFTKEEQLAMLNIADSINNIHSTGHFERHPESASLLKSTVKGLDEFDKTN